MLKLRLILLIAAVAFAVTLAVVVGLRLSDQAMAVVVGVIAGVAASIPTSLIVVWLTTRHLAVLHEARRREPEPEREASPQVVILQPTPTAAPQAFHPGYPVLPAQTVATPSRQFTIIGGDDTLGE